jgi:hypothetical protein
MSAPAQHRLDRSRHMSQLGALAVFASALLACTGSPIVDGPEEAQTDGSGTSDSGSTSGTSTGDTGSDAGSTGVGGTTEEDSGTTGASSPTDAGCPACIVLAWGLQEGRGVAIDEDYVYWTDQGAGTISRVLKGGGDGSMLVEGQSTPYSIAVDADHVYWTNFADDGAVMRVTKAGGRPEVIHEVTRPRALGITGEHVYWGTFETDWGVLGRRPISLADESAFIGSFGGGIADLVVGSDRIYFTVHAADTGGGAFIEPPSTVGSVRSAPIGEGVAATVINGIAQPWGIDLTDGRLYWVTGDGEAIDGPWRVSSATVEGADTQLLAAGNLGPWGITVDDARVYWTDFTEVKTVDAGGGDIVRLAEQQNSARTIVHDDAYVYWITRDRVLQRPKP